MDQRQADLIKPTLQLTQWTAEFAPGSALDIGFYNGRNAFYLAERGWQVTAIDRWEPFVDKLSQESATKGFAIKAEVAELIEYDPGSTFDLVLCLMVLHFLEAKQVSAAIEKLKAWTEPGGHCMVTGFTDANPEGTRPYLFARNELKGCFDGWEIEHYEEKYGGWFVQQGKTEPERFVVARIMARKPI
jgi:tellurite methyltransferase